MISSSTPVRALVALLALLGALVAWPSRPAAAAEVRLAPGDDLAAALADLGAGDTLVLGRGTHTLDAEVDLTASGRPGEPITLVGEGGREQVEITGSGRLHLIDAGRWVIEGITFRSVPLRLISDDALGHPFDSRIADNRFVGHGVQLRNAGSVEIEGNHFADVRSLQRGQDRHAIHLVDASGDLVIRDNLVENAGADAIQAQGLVDNVLVEGNEFRINRPHPADDPFCSTGENAIDVKRAERWVIRDNYFHGFQVVRDCPGFDSTSEGGEAIIIHKHGARDFEITGNRFENNTVHVLIVGKTCIDSGNDCGGPLFTQRIEVRDNEFRSVDIAGRTTGVKITPGIGTAELDPPVAPVDVTVADNTFVGLDIVVDVVVKTFETDSGDVPTRPGGVVVERNDYFGGQMKLAAAAGVTAAGNSETVSTGAGAEDDSPSDTTSAATPAENDTEEASTDDTAEPDQPGTTEAGASTAPAPGQPAAAGGGASSTVAAPADGGASTTIAVAVPVAQPELGSSFPWPWFVATGVMIIVAAMALTAWRARRSA